MIEWKLFVLSRPTIALYSYLDNRSNIYSCNCCCRENRALSTVSANLRPCERFGDYLCRPLPLEPLILLQKSSRRRVDLSLHTFEAEHYLMLICIRAGEIVQALAPQIPTKHGTSVVSKYTVMADCHVGPVLLWQHRSSNQKRRS